MRVLLSLLVSCGLLAGLGSSVSQAQQVDRPPQYVLLAFDGSLAIPMWQETRAVAAKSKMIGAPLNFTYFISGVYYVGPEYKKKYSEPTHGAGVSAIGWGSTSADLLARYDQTNLAYQEGNEIGSHANAHFDGSKWTLQNWRDEFRQFYDIIFNFFDFNGGSAAGMRPTASFPNGWLFTKNQVAGFRAPLLGTSPGLWDTLKEYGYRYDTSKTSQPNYWPQRDPKGGFWNFPLASLVIAGTGKHTLSMDYNFYFADSKGLPDPSRKETYKKQMLETYLQYFDRNYNGNRAPIHIGHHFSKWNGGAYWEAMQEFARQVCGRPEVKCVTYRELADFMDSRTPEQLKAYQAGSFAKPAPLRLSQGMPSLDVDVRMTELEPGVGVNSSDRTGFGVRLSGSDAVLGSSDRLEVRVNGRLMATDVHGLLDTDELRERHAGDTVPVETRLIREGVEIARSTQTLSAVGTDDEALGESREEDRALMGDLPEAHEDEMRMNEEYEAAMSSGAVLPERPASAPAAAASAPVK